MSDGEILRITEQHQGKICGRFRPDQVNRSLIAPPAKKGWHKWKSIAALVSGLLLGNEINAQSASPSIAYYQDKQQQKSEPQANLEGVVKDVNGTPLAYATIQLFVDGAYYAGMVTNEDGVFQLYVPPSSSESELEISYVGYQKEYIPLEAQRTKSQYLEIELKAGIHLEEIIVTQHHNRMRCYMMGELVMDHSPYQRSKEEKTEKTISIEKLKVYPNPFVDQIQVDIEIDIADHYLFQIYDGNGQLLLAEAKDLPIGANEVQLRVNTHWPAANYIFVVSNKKQNLFTKQLVKVNAE